MFHQLPIEIIKQYKTNENSIFLLLKDSLALDLVVVVVVVVVAVVVVVDVALTQQDQYSYFRSVVAKIGNFQISFQTFCIRIPKLLVLDTVFDSLVVLVVVASSSSLDIVVVGVELVEPIELVLVVVVDVVDRNSATVLCVESAVPVVFWRAICTRQLWRR